MKTIKLERKTKETDIKLSLNIYGKGVSDINTGVPFFDHMLTLFSKHGFFDIKLKAVGDVDVDFHHTVEDVGIAIGQAFKKYIGEVKNIKRYGFFRVPMDEALAEVVLDISGRPNLVFNVKLKNNKVGDFDTELVEAFLKGFADHFQTTLHINLVYGKNAHHCIEAVFKAFSKALSMALEKEVRYGVPSSKGSI